MQMIPCHLRDFPSLKFHFQFPKNEWKISNCLWNVVFVLIAFFKFIPELNFIFLQFFQFNSFKLKRNNSLKNLKNCLKIWKYNLKISQVLPNLSEFFRIFSNLIWFFFQFFQFNSFNLKVKNFKKLFEKSAKII